MNDRTIPAKERFWILDLQQRDLLILILAIISSALGYTLNNVSLPWPGFTLSALGLLNAQLPVKGRQQDERTIYLKYYAGYYTYALCIIGLIAVLLIANLTSVTIITARLPFYVLHASFITYTVLFAVIRRLR